MYLLGCISHIQFLKHGLESRQNRLMRHLLLSKHSNSTKHSKAAVLKFLGSHHIESFFGRGLQAKRIKSNVAGVVAIEEGRAECLIAEITQGLENTEKQ
jgi:hypothetical protein